VNKLAFTWWGGLVGPLLIPEVRCATCGYHFNGKTGGSVTASIVIYLLVVIGTFFVLVAVGGYFLATHMIDTQKSLR
jgi:hypothetical protein